MSKDNHNVVEIFMCVTSTNPQTPSVWQKVIIIPFLCSLTISTTFPLRKVYLDLLKPFTSEDTLLLSVCSYSHYSMMMMVLLKLTHSLRGSCGLRVVLLETRVRLGALAPEVVDHVPRVVRESRAPLEAGGFAAAVAVRGRDCGVHVRAGVVLHVLVEEGEDAGGGLGLAEQPGRTHVAAKVLGFWKRENSYVEIF